MHSSQIEDIYALTPMQAGILYVSLQSPLPAMYAEQGSCAIDGPLDIDRLRACWQSAVDAYPVLRTSIRWRGLSQPVQVVQYRASLDFRVLDCLDTTDWRARLHVLLDEDLARGFDPTAAPLLRVSVLKRRRDAHHLIWTYHHIVLDAWSEAIVLRHVMSAYNGVPGDAPPLFRHYVAWLARRSGGDREFWSRYLAGYTHRPVPIRVEGPWRGSQTTARLVPSDVRVTLELAAARTRVTPNAVMLGIWSTWLATYTDSDEVVVGVTMSGRNVDLPAADRHVGLLFETLPLRIRVGTHATFAQLVVAIQQDLTLLTGQHVSLQEFRQQAGVSAVELFDTVMVFLNASLQIAERNLGPCLVSDVQYRSHSNYALTFRVTDGDPMLFEVVADARCASAREAADILTYCEEAVRRLQLGPYDCALQSQSSLRKLSKIAPSTLAR